MMRKGKVTCPLCNGRKKIIVNRGLGAAQRKVRCAYCGGKGKVSTWTAAVR